MNNQVVHPSTRMLDQNPILLHTKLHRPRLPHDLVMRPRLVEWLDNGLDHPLTLVCASAGFGKTTLVCSWLEQMDASKGEKSRPMPAAWLSLDENDSDLNLFLRYFISALRTIFQDACADSLALLQAQQQLPLSILFATFSNELDNLPREAILVLDDYHLVHGNEVHDLLNHLVRHWPEKLHLVLLSRISPPIPIDRLRAKGMIRDIRTRDLRFTADEMAEYLHRSQAALLSQEDMQLLEERFEGWPAGLRLAALSMRSKGSQESVLMALSQDSPNIAGYLVDEVLSHQLPAIHTFLLKTSILDRLCAPLCEAVVGEGDPAWTARACLDWIERSELFIVSLDNKREWYRYHHLFQELLQQRVSTGMTRDEKNDLHLRASAWFEEHGLIDEALHHALAAGDLDLAARQMSAGLHHVIDREDRPTLERWLRLLPEEMIQQRPGLLMIRAWAFQHAWRLDLQAGVIQQVEGLLASEAGASMPESERQIIRGQILVLTSQWAYFTNQTAAAIQLCREALTLLPRSWTFACGGAMYYLGMSMQASGQALEAERLLLDEYESFTEKTNSYALLLLQALGFNCLKEGQLERTRQIAQLMLQAETGGRLEINTSLAAAFGGMAEYQRDHLVEAARYFTLVIDNRYTAHITGYREAVAGMAIIHQIKGGISEAWDLAESISRFDLEQSGTEDLRTSSLRAHLMLMQGDLEKAGSWADTLTDAPPDMALLWLEEPQVTRAHILVTRGRDTDLQSALQILESLEDIANRTHNTRHKIEVLALRALALEAQGKSIEALAALKQAVDLSRPGEFIRVFVDLGKPMQELLCTLMNQDHSGDAVRRILAHFPGEDQILSAGEVPAHHRSVSNQALVEPLTARELEILNLLRGPASVKEMAEQLHLSPATVKRHTNNIYAKLGVNKRWKAVARAEELNLLPAG
jgi:LuxR family transcriptional regulator, maltose regulon positive regulatory protein